MDCLRLPVDVAYYGERCSEVRVLFSPAMSTEYDVTT